MFGDIFGGVSSDQFNQSNQAHAVNYLALMLLLVEKGLVTFDEIDKARAKATHLVEQESAGIREESEAELETKLPGFREAFEKVTGRPL